MVARRRSRRRSDLIQVKARGGGIAYLSGCLLHPPYPHLSRDPQRPRLFSFADLWGGRLALAPTLPYFGGTSVKELRCIVFTDREVVAAITDRRRRINEPLPPGGFQTIALSGENGEVAITLSAADATVTTIGEQELQAALVAYCMAKNIPLPVDAEKIVHLIKGRCTLMVTMNFHKGARLIAGRLGADGGDDE